ncbi:MAG: methyl-accepting chemotaxis protein [Leptospirales bacterium]|nr:methyl-accepting chemotaxis protein [Leptospirales bacterium]
MEYTSRQKLEIKGALYYIIGYLVTFFFATLFQYIANAGFQAIFMNIIISSLNISLAIIIYIRKRNELDVKILPWILGFTTTITPIAVKYNHAFVDGWTFALRSINTTGVLIIFVILLSLFYQPKLFKFFGVYAISHWVVFLYLAYLNNAELYFQSYKDGKAILSGLIIWREISFIISIGIIFIIISRNLSGVISYDGQSTKQYNQIINQAEAQSKITEVIKNKTDSLFQQIDSQHTLLSDFNSNMESQAARFSEMSATMEEISGASEQIATESVTQVEGNVKMESIIDEFKGIRLGTKRNLDETYNDIQSVSDQSATANEHLMEVEKTVYAIKDQSSRIGQIVELIVDIADRINLLSLNASIEAARAGESGRGFAVVADEIGKLAFQTQESIKEINSVISSSSKSTIDGATVIQKTAQMMRDMISRMDQGANKIRTLQESLLIEDRFTQIIINQMNDNITQAKKISTATDEQKIAVATSFKTIEEVINILDGMVAEAKGMAKISDEIHNNATDIITKTKQIAIETEIASNNDDNDNKEG